jgi:hypothetical protein
VNLRGWNFQEIVDRVVEKLQQIRLQQGIYRCAACRRRSKRRCNCLAVPATSDRNIRAKPSSSLICDVPALAKGRLRQTWPVAHALHSI